MYPIFIGSWICIHNYPGVSGYSAVFMSRIKISTTTLWYQLYSGLSKLLRILSLRLLFKFRFKIENLLEYWVWGFLLSEFKFEIKTLKRVETVCRASSCYSTRLSLDIVFFCTSNLSFWNFELFFLRVLCTFLIFRVLYHFLIGSWIYIYNYPGVSGYSAVFKSSIKIIVTCDIGTRSTQNWVTLL